MLSRVLETCCAYLGKICASIDVKVLSGGVLKNGVGIALETGSCGCNGKVNSMKKRELITKIMTTDLLTVEHGNSISSVRKIFEDHHVHHLPVVNGENLVGIVTWNDFMRITFGDFPDQDVRSLDAMLDHTYQLDDVMRRAPVSVSTKATIGEAAEILGSGNFHSLPVVDGKKLVGIVTSSDLIRYLADLV